MSEKKKTFTRPSGWAKTFGKSYWDAEKKYDESTDAEEQEESEEEREEKAKKAGSGRFGKLLKRVVGG